MALGGRLGGHLVQGHVDGTGELIVDRKPGRALGDRQDSRCPPALARYVVEKGSITVDGVSLTVVDAGRDYFTVSLIPTTLALTTLGIKQRRRPGQPRGRRPRQVRRAAARRPADRRRSRGRTPASTAVADERPRTGCSTARCSVAGSARPLVRDMIGNIFGLASALLGLRRSIWAWPVADRQRRCCSPCSSAASSPPAGARPLRAGRQAGRRHRRQRVRLVAVDRATAGPDGPDQRGGRRRAGPPARAGCCWLVAAAVGTAGRVPAARRARLLGPAGRRLHLRRQPAGDVRHGPRLGRVLVRLAAVDVVGVPLLLQQRFSFSGHVRRLRRLLRRGACAPGGALPRAATPAGRPPDPARPTRRPIA